MEYKVLHYENYKDLSPKVIHKSNSGRATNVFNEGVLELKYNAIDTLNFTIDVNNVLYLGIKPYQSIIDVVDSKANKTLFKGRVLKPKTRLSGGIHTQSFVCESLLGYLNDTAQSYAKIPNQGAEHFFRYIMDIHNKRAPEHKRFKIGQITMTSDSDVPYRYIDYGKTMDIIREFVIGKIGGVIRIRYENDGNYIDWLEEYGEVKRTKLKPVDNLLGANRETNFDEVVTRLIPVGATLNTGESNTDSNATHERLTIKTVNGGLDYIDDKELIDLFGVIEDTKDWSDIDVPSVLKARGQQYLESQKAILTSWETEMEERAWIDSRFEVIEIGNYYPIDDPYIGPEETLKVVGKQINLLSPEVVNVTIGDTVQTLSGYIAQMREANKSIQRVQLQNQINKTLRDTLESELSNLKSELSTAQSTNSSSVSELQARIAAIEAQLGGTT